MERRDARVGLAMAALLAIGLLSECATASATRPGIAVPWHAGYADAFQMGAAEERRARSAQGTLPVTIFRPAGAGPFPFVVLLHGCGGLHREAMWTSWVEPWAHVLRTNGIGAAVVDSFTPRGVDQVCTGNVAAWAARRADDAHSVRAWLAEQPYADAARIAVMGMSNGGRAVLAALRLPAKHPAPFVAGVALYPGCQSDGASTFGAPLLVLIGRADSVTPAHSCEDMARSRLAAPPLNLVVYPRAPHTFDMPLPDRTVLGMRLGYDAEAAADARQQVVAFLAAHGIVQRAADSNEVLPADAAFKERRDLCDHFRSEEAYDAERRRVLEQSLKRYCTGTDKELTALRSRDKSNATVLRVLAAYDDRIEPND